MPLQNPYKNDKYFCLKLNNAEKVLNDISNMSFEKCEKPQSIDEVKEIVFSINVYRIGIIGRIQELSSSFEMLWNKKEYLGCFLLCRALLETFSHFINTASEIAETNNKDSSKFIKVLMKSTLGTNLVEEAHTPYHISDCNRSFKKLINNMGGDGDRLLDLYDELSEFTHPNYFSVSGTYVEFSKSDKDILAVISKENVFEMRFLNICIEVFEYFQGFEYCNGLFETLLDEMLQEKS